MCLSTSNLPEISSLRPLPLAVQRSGTSAVDPRRSQDRSVQVSQLRWPGTSSASKAVFEVRSLQKYLHEHRRRVPAIAFGRFLFLSACSGQVSWTPAAAAQQLTGSPPAKKSSALLHSFRGLRLSSRPGAMRKLPSSKDISRFSSLEMTRMT